MTDLLKTGSDLSMFCILYNKLALSDIEELTLFDERSNDRIYVPLSFKKLQKLHWYSPKTSAIFFETILLERKCQNYDI